MLVPPCRSEEIHPELWVRAVDGDREAAVRGGSEAAGWHLDPRRGADRRTAAWHASATPPAPALPAQPQPTATRPRPLSAFDCGIQVILLAPYSAVWQPLTTGSLRQRALPCSSVVTSFGVLRPEALLVSSQGMCTRVVRMRKAASGGAFVARTRSRAMSRRGYEGGSGRRRRAASGRRQPGGTGSLFFSVPSTWTHRSRAVT